MPTTKCLIAIAVDPVDLASDSAAWCEPAPDKLDTSVIDDRVLQALRPEPADEHTRWRLPLDAERKIQVIASPKKAKEGSMPISGALTGIDGWTWPSGPRDSKFSVVVVQLTLELPDGMSRAAALDALSPRWDGGRIRFEDDATPAGVGLVEFLSRFGLSPHRKQSVCAWHMPWSVLDDVDRQQAARAARPLGSQAGSAHFAVSDRKLLMLARDASTPVTYLEQVGTPIGDATKTANTYAGFTRLGTEALAYACAQRAGLDAFRRDFGISLRDLKSADLRRRYAEWLAFRHWFPRDVHFESNHMAALYDAAVDHLGISELHGAVEEEHRLSMQLERDQAADQTTDAVARLTNVAGALALLAVAVTVADGLRADETAALPGYAIAAAATALLGLVVWAFWLRPTDT